MNTRRKIYEEVQLFFLHLNPIRKNANDRECVAISTDYKKLVEYAKGELAPEGYGEVDPLVGCTIWKRYKKGSKLEFYNPPKSLELNNLDFYGRGIDEAWVSYDNAMGMLKGYEIHVVCRD